jgi:TnpA family transposase
MAAAHLPRDGGCPRSRLQLAADYSHVLQGRGVTLYAHTADNCLRLHQQPIPCRLREAAFVLDGLVEHELDPRTCYTDTHGYTEVVMATAVLLGFELAPHASGTFTTRRFTSSTTANITLTWTPILTRCN